MSTKKSLTTDDSRVIILNKSFAASSLPNTTINDENIGYTRYFLFPKSAIDISKLNNINRIYFNVIYDLTRSKGTATTNIYGTYGNTSSNTDFRNVFISQTSNKTDYILQQNLVAGVDNSDIAKYVNNTYVFSYNGNEYYCVKYYGSFGLSKFTGSINLKKCIFGVEYEDSSLVYNGDKPITSAYLGNTKLNGIYLGSNKLL